MYKLLTDDIFKTKLISDESFYCGDEAGRKGDKSNDDILFAMNTKMTYFTPEMLWNGKKINFPILPGLKIDKKFEIVKKVKTT